MKRDCHKYFGMGLSRVNLPVRRIAEFLDFSVFSAMEIPLEVLDEEFSVLSKKILRSKTLARIHCGGIMDRELSRNILSTGKRMRDEFAEHAEFILGKLARKGIRTAAFECGMNNALCDKVATEAVLRILKKLAPILLKNEITLLLPFRIPSQTRATTENMTAFLRECMIPNVKARLDIHPHELKPDFTVRESIGLLRFETRSVIFIYNADSGNQLLPIHITPWIENLEEVGFDGPFFCCPNSQDQRLCLPEAELFAKNVESLRKS